MSQCQVSATHRAGWTRHSSSLHTLRGCTGAPFTCFLKVHVTLWSGRTSVFSFFSTNLATKFVSALLKSCQNCWRLYQLFYTHIPYLITDMPKSNPPSTPALVRWVYWYPHCPKIPSTSRDTCVKQRQMVTKRTNRRWQPLWCYQ